MEVKPPNMWHLFGLGSQEYLTLKFTFSFQQFIKLPFRGFSDFCFR